ncbi:hypothetical protein [uncultured Rhodoblastus sp.]|uniref:hypothetical protein n=1 Tax=uncultured Rhodoblastus sp. TaxID=543037 RepID=UPI0025EAF192|nr:hypothetical protein [uncultured Rhodoblastus sp.]
MINIRELRFWTILLMVGLSMMAIATALPTLRFAVAAQLADPQTVNERLQPSTIDPPMAPLALRLTLVLAPPKSPAERVDALQALLGLTPLVGGAWLDLAIARQQAGQPMQNVASALALSSLTGPNEVRFMAGRAVFGLPLWERLPPDVRRGLIGDLVGGWGGVTTDDRRDLDAILTVASDQTRAEISAALLLAGKPAEPIMKALDLSLETIVPPVVDREETHAEPPQPHDIAKP